jgi:preprotein translocase subunit SecE
MKYYEYIEQEYSLTIMCTKSETLNITLLIFAVVVAIAVFLTAATGLVYGEVYLVYHEEYDMTNGCLKNTPKCYHKDRLSCHDADLWGCFLGGIVVILVTISFLGILMLLAKTVRNIYHECNNVDDLSEKQGAESSANDNAMELEQIMTQG